MKGRGAKRQRVYLDERDAARHEEKSCGARYFF